MDTKVLYQVALTMVKGVGALTARKLTAAFGSEEQVFKASKRDLLRVAGIGAAVVDQLRQPDLIQRAEQELERVVKMGARILHCGDDAYPRRLLQCEDHPWVLYAKGEMELNPPRVLGVVGTRKMTPYGKCKCEEILSSLHERYPDLLIVSGLAYGVDGCAHRKSLSLGMQTVGVLGHGLEMIYPAQHRQLADQMRANGGLLTEFLPYSYVDRKNFVSRNRIIAGMSDVTLVVESGRKGGAMLTAEFANSYNRDVCAIPGRVGDLCSEGCNWLIKKNMAAMAECAEDIETLMNWGVSESKPSVQMSLFMELNERERLVVDALQIEPRMQIDQLARKLQLPVSSLSPILFGLEMNGVVFSMPGGVYSLR